MRKSRRKEVSLAPLPPPSPTFSFLLLLLLNFPHFEQYHFLLGMDLLFQ